MKRVLEIVPGILFILCVWVTCGGELMEVNGFALVQQHPVGMSYGLDIAHPYLYVTTNEGAEILDIEVPQRLKRSGHIDIGKACFAIAARDSIVFLGGEGTLTVVNVSSPHKPIVVHKEDISGSVYNLSVTENYLFVLDIDNGLDIYDVLNPVVPVKVGHFEAGYGNWALTIHKDILYLANIVRGLMVLDVSDPPEWKLLGTVADTKGARCLAINRDMLFVGTHNQGVKVFDISTKASPEFLYVFLESQEVQSVQVVDQILYCSLPEFGIRALNIRDPYKPEEIAYLTPGRGHGLKYHNGLLYYAGREVIILKLLAGEIENSPEKSSGI